MAYEHSFCFMKEVGNKVLYELGIQCKDYFIVELCRKMKSIMENRAHIELKKEEIQ